MLGLPAVASSCSKKKTKRDADIVQKLLYQLQEYRQNYDNDVDQIKKLHACIREHKLEQHSILGNHLLTLLVECGCLSDAQTVFDHLHHRSERSWTSLISGYIDFGERHHAFHLYHKMQNEQVSPTSFTYVCLLKACSMVEFTEQGRLLHSNVVKKGFDLNIIVGSSIVNMYVKCGEFGSLPDAHKVFDCLVCRNEYSWSSLILGYAEYGEAQSAFLLYQKMQEDLILPNSYTFVALLKACIHMNEIQNCRMIHAEIIMKGLESDVSIGNTLVHVFGNCGSLSEAHEILDQLKVRNVISWTTLVAAYAEHGFANNALLCFKHMQLERVSPVVVTYICSLKACGISGVIETAQGVHTEVVKRNIENGLSLANTLMDSYCKCGFLLDAHKVFDMLSIRDTVSWNTLMIGYAELGLAEETLTCFEQMLEEGICPVDATFVNALKACDSIKAIGKGCLLCTAITIKGLERNLCVGSTMVDFYVNCGMLVEARSMFQQLFTRDVVSWNAIITGYAENGYDEEVLNFFKQMAFDNVSPDSISFACSLRACSSKGALEIGQRLHADAIRYGLEDHLSVGNTLVDMYGKCGSLEDGRHIFGKLASRDVISWTAMIKGYGENHEADKAIQCFEGMQEQGIEPDATTFLCLLAACSHANLIHEGHEYFKSMIEKNVEPNFDHYSCMIDLLARSGNVYAAERYIETVDCATLENTLTTLLCACRIHGDIYIGMRCFLKLIEINKAYAAAYLLMADIFAQTWSKGLQIESMEKDFLAKVEMKDLNAKGKIMTLLVKMPKIFVEDVGCTAIAVMHKKQTENMTSQLVDYFSNAERLMKVGHRRTNFA